MQPAIIIHGHKPFPVSDRDASPVYVLMSGDETYHLVPMGRSCYRLQRFTDTWERLFPSLEGAVAYVNALDQSHQRRSPRRPLDSEDD